MHYIYFPDMSSLRLPPLALWDLCRRLTRQELFRVRKRIAGTRLEWLLDTLRDMKTFSETRLHTMFARAFPGTDKALLRTYKKQLWQLLEEILSSPESSITGKEVHVWQRLWLSATLWQKGMHESAEILWYQGMQTAIKMGWYEVALWGLALLEMFARDFHRIGPDENVSEWGRQLLELVHERYGSIFEKLQIVEKSYVSRRPHGWHLPPLPSTDIWGEFMRDYAALLKCARTSDFVSGLYDLIHGIEKLWNHPPFPPVYVQFHLAIAWLNLGLVLLNLCAGELFEKWYQAWYHLWETRYWPAHPRFEQIFRAGMASYFGYLVRVRRWKEALIYRDKYRDLLESHVFEEGENVIFRMQIALSLYLVLLISPGRYREAVQWRLRVEPWVEKEGLRDYPYLWWVFLRWYETFRDGNKAWMRHWYRKLRHTYTTHFTHISRWQPVLALAKALTYALPITQQRRIQSLLNLWKQQPELRREWEGSAAVFPMPAFVEGLRRRQPLEALSPVPLEPDMPLPNELVQKVHNILHTVYHIKPSQTGD